MSKRGKCTFLSQLLTNPNASSSNSNQSHVNQVYAFHMLQSDNQVDTHVAMPLDSVLVHRRLHSLSP